MTDFFDGFAWAVPLAFRDALGQAAFTEGDCLYSSREAYGEWGDVPPADLRHWISVTWPRKAGASVARAEEGDIPLEPIDASDVFARNWNSPIGYTLHDVQTAVETQNLTATQGRVIRLLQSGDLDVLDAKRTSPPALPLLLQDLDLTDIRRNPRIAVEALPVKARSKVIVFLLPLDPTNPVSFQKAASLMARVVSPLKGQTYHLTLNSLCIRDADRFMPTVAVRALVFHGQQVETVHDALKDVLYRPSPDKQVHVDRFRLDRHGELLELGD